MFLFHLKGEVVMDDKSYNRERAETLTRTRNMAMWHDHSEILGRPYTQLKIVDLCTIVNKYLKINSFQNVEVF